MGRENVETSLGGWEPESLFTTMDSLKQILLQMTYVTQNTLSLTHEVFLGRSTIIDLIARRKNGDNKALSLCCYF